MDLTPQDIEKKTFHDTFRGYSQKEVDEFLDQVSETFARIHRENQSLHQRLKEVENQFQEARATEEMLKRTLVTATKAAEETVERAKAEAHEVTAEAARKAQRMLSDAETRAREIVADAAKRESDLTLRIDGLKRFEEEYRLRIQALIESQLRVLSEGPIAPASQAPAPARTPAPTPPSGEPATPSPAPPAEAEAQDRSTPAAPAPAAPAAARPPASAQPGAQPGTPPGGPEREGAPGWTPAPPSKSLGPQPVNAGAGKGDAREEPKEAEAKAGEKDELEEERTIKRLFWGED